MAKGIKGMAIDNGKYLVDIAFKSEVVVEGRKCGGSYLNPDDERARGMIEILGTLDRFSLAENLWHEFAHDCEYAETVDLGTREQAEAIILAITGYQCRLLRNNPGLAKFFIEGLCPDYKLTVKGQTRGGKRGRK